MVFRACSMAWSHLHLGSQVPAPGLCAVLEDYDHRYELPGWTGLSPATTRGMVLVSDPHCDCPFSPTLSPNPVYYCVCRHSFSIFEQGRVVLHFISLYFVFGGKRGQF